MSGFIHTINTLPIEPKIVLWSSREDFFIFLRSLKNPTVCLGCLTVALKNVPIGQRQPIITLRLASRVGLTQDDLPGPQLMISVVEPFVTVCGERFHLFTHQSLSSGLLRVLRPSSDIHLPVYSACPNDQTSLR